MLKLITFSVYSAWAKVRCLQYFDRNIWLGGASFDCHGARRDMQKKRIELLRFCFTAKSCGLSLGDDKS
jgi:uncharacterized membrane protein YjgN (DUF898 family)